VLGLWHGKIPDAVRALRDDNGLKKSPPMVTAMELDIVVNAWLTAARRWCRRYVRMGLYNLVCRPGRLAVTPTHVDLLFDHRQADIHIRKAGVDIDPGWVPWFGRVVQFHYQYGEHIHGA
jgi:hypothetical protein